MIKNIELSQGENLVLDQNVLESAGLAGKLRLIVEQGEIRIVANDSANNPETILAELAGCLGEEPATNYDFNLKLDSLYETR